MFQTNVRGKNRNTHFTFIIPTRPLPPEDCAVYKIMRKKCGGGRQATVENIIVRLRFACRVTKDRMQTHTQEYVIFTAFPLHQGFPGRVSVLRHTYIACLVTFLLLLSTRAAH